LEFYGDFLSEPTHPPGALAILDTLVALSVGDRLGRFEILGALGAGGMGEVYRARDPQLQREVAIKVLRPGRSSDPHQERRFEREARAAASLSHPNIVAVHDLGVHEGAPFIVTELLEGESLRQRTRGKRLSPRQAVDFAVQIASGLAAGHERGIVHRDIKPDNLFVTSEERIKILDFGLAKLANPDVSSDATQTITIDGMELGPVMGTAMYMSPEQARGLSIDHRSDIFSFGAVVYQMLAGFPPFRRSTTADTLSAILNDEPQELSSIVAVPPGLERIVYHCLEKKPENRFQNARDLMFDLEAVRHSSWTTAPRTRGHRALSRTGALIGAVFLVVSAAAAALGYLVGKQSLSPAPALALHNARRVTDFPGLEESPAISPDQRSVAFTANVNGTRQLFVRLLAGGPPLLLTKDAADHQLPRWAPDGNSLVYFSPAQSGDVQGAIWQIPALGGPPRRIMASLGGADVSRAGRLVCFQLADRQIQLVTAAPDGSDPRVILQSLSGYHRYPRWSPDSRWIAFQRGDGVRDDVFLVAASGGEPRQLTHDRNTISGLAWLPSGDGIVYGSSRGSTIPYLPSVRLWEVGLNGQTPHPITQADLSYEQPDVHLAGQVSVTRVRMQFDIWSFPFDGTAAENVRRAQAVTRQTGQVLTPTAAPGGDEIAFLADSGGHANLWVAAASSGSLRQITFESDPAVAIGVPVWSPDGASIAFVSSKGRTGFEFGIWLVNPDGGNLRMLVKEGLGLAWSPDGKWLYYVDIPAGVLNKIASTGGPPVKVRAERTRNVIGVHAGTLYYMVERPLVDGRPEFEILAASPEDGPSRLLARIPASRVPAWQIVNPALSPDGQWLALPLTDGFTTNVWALSTASGMWRQVTDFGDRPVFIARRVSWSADGSAILAAIGEGDADVVLLDGLFDR
jgi:eukaryotic-like serine/threonine-protein kinase